MKTSELVLELLRQLENREIDEFKFVRDTANPFKAEIWVDKGVYAGRRLIDHRCLSLSEMTENDEKWIKEKEEKL